MKRLRRFDLPSADLDHAMIMVGDSAQMVVVAELSDHLTYSLLIMLIVYTYIHDCGRIKQCSLGLIQLESLQHVHSSYMFIMKKQVRQMNEKYLYIKIET